MKVLPLVAAIINIVLALFFIGISMPLVLGKVSMNRTYGIRFAKSFESEELWFKINRYGGWQLIIWSIPIAVLGLVVLVFPTLATGPINFLLVTCAVPLICILAAVMTSYHYAKKQ